MATLDASAGPARTGEQFPEFSLSALDGTSWSRERFAGQSTVLFVFASWCTCKEQLPGWQHYWDSRGRDFTMVAAILDAKGEETARPTVEASGATFPVLLDPTSSLGALCGSQVVPFGVLIDEAGTTQMIDVSGTFDIADPRVRVNLESFLAGDPVEQPEPGEAMNPAALELFAEGVIAYRNDGPKAALELWREALELDPDNFIVRSQIWALEHPEHFWPEVDRGWQELQLQAEGYDKPLP